MCANDPIPLDSLPNKLLLFCLKRNLVLERFIDRLFQAFLQLKMIIQLDPGAGRDTKLTCKLVCKQ